MASSSASALLALSAAALLIPGMVPPAQANSLEKDTRFDFMLSNYQEGQLAADKLGGGSPDRYQIDVAQFSFSTSFAQDRRLSVAGVQESMSGASGWYVQPDENGKLLQVMSGATISEERSELDLGVQQGFKHAEVSLAGSYSHENDYQSLGGGISGSFHFNQNLTTLELGINGSKDYINATDADLYPSRPTDKVKNRFGALVGLSRVLSKNSLVGVSLSYSSLQGFLSDAYKLALVEGLPQQDSRPGQNQQYAVDIMWRQYVTSANAALHVDYRYFANDWQLRSHTLELAWFQNLGHNWQLIPSLRFYQQTQAAFYQPYYTQARMDGYYSSDYRLSAFNASSGQLKLLKRFDHFYLEALYEHYSSSGRAPALIDYNFYSLGAGLKF